MSFYSTMKQGLFVVCDQNVLVKTLFYIGMKIGTVCGSYSYTKWRMNIAKNAAFQSAYKF